MKTYRQMIGELNICMRTNMWKALFSFLLMSILETLIMSVFSMPVFMLLSEDGSVILTLILAVMSLFCGFVFVMLLQYGYQVLLLRLVRKEYVTLGFLFNGFRERKRISKACALVSFGLIIALAVCQVFAVVANIKFSAQIQKMTLPVLAGIILAVYAFISILLLIRFVFVFVCLNDNPQMKIIAVFKLSASLLKKRCIRLAGFVLYAGGTHLLIAAAIFIAMLFIPAKLDGMKGFLVSILEFVYFIAAYTAAVRMFMAVPLFYTNVVQKTEPLETPAQIAAPEVLLSPPGTGSGTGFPPPGADGCSGSHEAVQSDSDGSSSGGNL